MQTVAGRKRSFGVANNYSPLLLAVETAYGVNFKGDEEKITAHLFQLYAQATARANA